MKFKTFRNIAVAAGVVVVVGVVGGAGMCTRSSMAAAEAKRSADAEAADRLAKAHAEIAAREEAKAAVARERIAVEQAAAQHAQDENPAKFFATAPGLTPCDSDVLTALQRPVTDQVKDATAGKKYKVNLYADNKTRFNRAKVDLNRNEKWDESWTVKADGTIEKKVAPNDDEKYTTTLRLDKAGGWVSLDASKPAATPAIAPAVATSTSGGGGLSASDQQMLALIKSLPPQEKIKDATKGQPFKINLYSDDGAHWGRAKVDLDRDDKWDESWTFKGSGAEKKVAPNDDEAYTTSLKLAGNTWAPN